MILNTANNLTAYNIFYGISSAEGCAYFDPPENMHVTFDDETYATVVCNFTRETWFLTCERFPGNWLGTIGNCTEGK